MINKNKFSIKDTKKVLHKVGKRWVVVSAVLLGLVAGGAAVTAQANASTNTSLGTEETAVEDQNNPKTVPFHGHNIPENKAAVESDATKYASYADVNNLTKVASVARANNQASAYSSLVNLAQNPQRFISHANNSSEVAVGSDVANNSDKNTAFSMFDQASNEASAINSGKDNSNKLNKINHAFSFANSLANKSSNISNNVSFSSTFNMFTSKTASNSTVVLPKSTMGVKSALNSNTNFSTSLSSINADIGSLNNASLSGLSKLSAISMPSMSFTFSNVSGSINFKSNVESTLSVPTLINDGYSNIPSTIINMIISAASNASSAINNSADSIANSGADNLKGQISSGYSSYLSSGINNLHSQVSSLAANINNFVYGTSDEAEPNNQKSNLIVSIKANIGSAVNNLRTYAGQLENQGNQLNNTTLKSDITGLANDLANDLTTLVDNHSDTISQKEAVFTNLQADKDKLNKDKNDASNLFTLAPIVSSLEDHNTSINPASMADLKNLKFSNQTLNENVQSVASDLEKLNNPASTTAERMSDGSRLSLDLDSLGTHLRKSGITGINTHDISVLTTLNLKSTLNSLDNNTSELKNNLAKLALANKLPEIENVQDQLTEGPVEGRIYNAISAKINKEKNSVASDINNFLGLSNGQPVFSGSEASHMVPSLLTKYSSILSAAGIINVGPFKSDGITLTSAANSLSASENAIDSAVSIVASVKNKPALNNHISAINNLISTASNYANDITNKYNDLGSGEKASLISNFNGMVSGAADLANNYDYDTQYPAYSAIYSNASSLVSNITNDVNLSAYPVISDAMSYAQSSIADEAEASANTMTSTSNSMSGFLQAASNAISNANSSVKNLENSLLSANTNNNNAIGRVTSASSAYDTISLGDADTSEAALDTDNITVDYKLNGNTKASKSVALEGLSGESFPVSALSNFYNSSDYSKYTLVNSPASTIPFNGNGSSADVTITLSSASSSAKTPSSSSAKTPSTSSSSVAPSSSSSAKSSSASNSSVAPSSENSSASISSNASGMPFIPSFNGGSTIVTPTTSTSVAPSSMSANSNSSSAESKSKVANYVTVNKDLQLHTSPNFTKKNGVAVIKAGTRLDLEKIVRARHGLVRYEVRYNGKNYFVTANKKFTTHISYELAKPSHFRYLRVDKSLQLHTSPYFTKKNGVIVKKPSTEFRINRVVRAHGLVRYEVSYKGNIYFITANDHYVENAYLQKGNFGKRGHKSVRVTKNLSEYKKANFKKHSLIRNFRKGSVLPVKRVITIAKGEMTRLQLTNGRYVTANKDFVKVIK